MKRIITTAALAAFLLGAVGWDAMATMATGSQETVVVTDEPSCPECEITLDLVVSLGSKTVEEGLICQSSDSMVVDSRGRFYLVGGCVPGTVDVYDNSGRFVESIGEFGEGPGELGHIIRIAMGDDDSLHVFDTVRRHTVLTSAGEFVRMVRVPTHPGPVLINPDGSSVQQLTLNGPARVGLPLHLIDSDGEIVRSFGAVDPTSDQDQRWRATRSIARAAGDRLWSAPPAPYEIELWTLSGTREMRVRRDAAWFPPRNEEMGPTITSIRQDPDGRLWTAVVVPAADWDWESDPPPQGPTGLQKVLDTVIEVIDPIGGHLVTSTVVDEFLSSSVGNMLYGLREDDDGDLFVDVWRVHLKQPN